MVSGTGIGIVAHIIVGRKPEPYLAAVLESIAHVVDHAVINDNSGLPSSPNAAAILQSRLALSGRLTLAHSIFTDFATARNVCLTATPSEFSKAWALFVDADEVHGDEISAMAALLPALPADVDGVDGYSRHFVGSFSWWMAMERRLCFFRMAAGRTWRGAIHEQLAPMQRRIVLPALWFHYGHVVTPRAEAEKSQLYASLGQGDEAPSDAQIRGATPASVWTTLLRRARRFRGEHPPVVQATIAQLTEERLSIFREVDVLASRQSILDRLRNALAQLNNDRLIAWRALEARLRWNWPNTHLYATRKRVAASTADEKLLNAG